MKKVIFFTIVIFVFFQLIPVHLPVSTKQNPADLIKTANVPVEVAKILKTSCYDCHSNETVYPWYSDIAPFSYLVKRDVEKGRKELNFSEWDNLKKVKKAKKLDEIAEEVKEGDMPMTIYTFIHSDTKLSKRDKEIIVKWANDFAESLFAK